MSIKSTPTAPARIIFTDENMASLDIPKFARFEVEAGSLAVYALDGDGDLSLAAVVGAGQWAYLALSDNTGDAR